MNTERETLWQQMADLTLKKCRQKCHRLGSCCDVLYCEMAREIAAKEGVTLTEGNGGFRDSNRDIIPFLDAGGSCIVSPMFRPLCSLHQCDINSLGNSPGDEEWTQQYFDLREQLESIEEESLDDLRV